MTQPNTIILDNDSFNAAISVCRGVYQSDIINGRQAISTADLKGKAKEYGAHYRRSIRNLLQRMEDRDIKHKIIKAKKGKLILVIGEPPFLGDGI